MTSPTPGAREPALVDAVVALADTLVDDYDVIDLLHRLVETSIQLLAADSAGILLSDGRGQLQVMAYSTEQVRRLELLQLTAHQGPCLDCFHTGWAISEPDLIKAEDRWSQFAPRAAQEGLRAVHALPMRLRSVTIGALNLFRTQPGPMPPQDIRVAQALADVATIGILQERALRRSEIVTEQLQGALNSRVVIEQANGVLAERIGLDFPDAFALLRGHARRTGLRLSDVARGVAEGTITLDILLRDATRSSGRS
jgi:transcriptional regulator with GAF, ATPase, and Fis domain